MRRTASSARVSRLSFRFLWLWCNILMTRNLSFNSELRKWSHSLMTPSHFFLAKRYGVWREWGRWCDVNQNHRRYSGLCPIWGSVRSNHWRWWIILQLLCRRHITVIPGSCFLLIDLLSFVDGISFEIKRPRLRGWKNFGWVDEQGERVMKIR